ncbi:hypothetical protein RKD37_001732 [Streptomyces ambofaciens]
MTRSLHYAHTLTALAALTTAGATWLALTDRWLPAAALAYTTLFFGWLAAREYANHRRTLAEHEWARRCARGEQPPPLTPCCRLGHSTRGAAHDHGCTDLAAREQARRESAA